MWPPRLRRSCEWCHENRHKCVTSFPESGKCDQCLSRGIECKRSVEKKRGRRPFGVEDMVKFMQRRQSSETPRDNELEWATAAAVVAQAPDPRKSMRVQPPPGHPGGPPLEAPTSASAAYAAGHAAGAQAVSVAAQRAVAMAHNAAMSHQMYPAQVPVSQCVVQYTTHIMHPPLQPLLPPPLQYQLPLPPVRYGFRRPVPMPPPRYLPYDMPYAYPGPMAGPTPSGLPEEWRHSSCPSLVSWNGSPPPPPLLNVDVRPTPAEAFFPDQIMPIMPAVPAADRDVTRTPTPTM